MFEEVKVLWYVDRHIEEKAIQNGGKSGKHGALCKEGTIVIKNVVLCILVINMIREFAEKHMKSGEVKLDQDLNRQIWARGKTNPPRKVRVKMVKDEDDVVTVSLYEEPVETTAVTPTPADATEAPAAEVKPEEQKVEAAKQQ